MILLLSCLVACFLARDTQLLLQHLLWELLQLPTVLLLELLQLLITQADTIWILMHIKLLSMVINIRQVNQASCSYNN